MLMVLRVGAHYSASSSPRPAASCKIPGNEPGSEPAHELVKEALVGDARFRAQCACALGKPPRSAFAGSLPREMHGVPRQKARS